MGVGGVGSRRWNAMESPREEATQEAQTGCRTGPSVGRAGRRKIKEGVQV